MAVFTTCCRVSQAVKEKESPKNKKRRPYLRMFGIKVLCEKKKRIKQPALQELYFIRGPKTNLSTVNLSKSHV
jgi:hypothetical protein